MTKEVSDNTEVEFVVKEVPYITRSKWGRFYLSTKTGFVNGEA